MSYPSEVYAAGYPDRAITLVVPFAPGGVTDLAARAVAEPLEKQLKQPVVVVNKTGGASTVGGYAVASAKPDGYTIGLFPDRTSLPEVFSSQFQAPYSSKDLTPICNFFVPVLALTVKGDAPWNNIQELFDYARKNPGMKVGTHGKGSTADIVRTLMNKMEKTSFIDVPLESDTKMTPAVLGDHIPIGIITFPAIASLYEAKKVKVLAFVAIEKRAPFAPEIPTLAERGYKLTCIPYDGLFFPKGASNEAVKKIDEAMRKIVEEPTFKTWANGMGIQLRYQDTNSFEKFLTEYKQSYETFLKEEGLVK